MNINKNIISFVLFSSLLTACSGGGGGGSSNADTPNDSNTLKTQPVAQAPIADAAVPAAPVVQAPAADAAVPPAAPVVQAPAADVAVPPAAPVARAPIADAAVPPAAPVVQAPVADAGAPAVQPQEPELPVADVQPSAPESYKSFFTDYSEVTGLSSIKRHSTFGIDPDSQFHVKLSGTDLVVEAEEFMINDPRDNRSLLDHNLTALRDVDGTLLGYYGRVSTQTHLENALDDDDVDKVTDTYIYSMDMDKRRLPDIAADYAGKVYYNKADIRREANISLHYEDRMVTGSIKGTAAGLNSDVNYIINNDGNVDDNGGFAATMRHHYQREGSMSGTINGAFYGEGGDVAVGRVALDIGDADGLARSAGVFGAKRVSPEGGK